MNKPLKLLFVFALMLMSGNIWADNTVTWQASKGALGDKATYQGVSGTISTGDFEWSYTRKLFSGECNTDWVSKCIQLGKNGGIV